MTRRPLAFIAAARAVAFVAALAQTSSAALELPARMTGTTAFALRVRS